MNQVPASRHPRRNRHHAPRPGLLPTLRTGLAATFLVPLLAVGLVLSGPAGTASAATSYGAQKAWSLRSDVWEPGGDIQCDGFAWYRFEGSNVEAEQTVRFKGDCDTGPGVNLSGDSYSFAFKGYQQGSTETSCVLIGNGAVETDDQETIATDTASFFLPTQVNAAEACHVTQVCLTIVDEGWNGDTNRDFGCKSVDLGIPALPDDLGRICDRTSGGRPWVKWGAPSHDPTSTTNNWVEARWFGVSKVMVMGGVQFYMVVRPENGTTGHQVIPLSGNGGAAGGGWNPAPAGPGTSWRFDGHWQPLGNAGPGVRFKPVGMGFWLSDLNPNLGNHANLPQNNPLGRYGVTKPSVCAFYWGEKIAQVENSDEDDPIGGVQYSNEPTGGTEPDPTTPPADVGPDCEFSITDPTTWASGGMCAALGVLGMIWEVLKGIAATLVNLADWIVGPIVDAVMGLLGVLGDILTALGDIAGDILDGLFDAVRDVLKWAFDPPQDLSWGEVVVQAESRAPWSVVIDLVDVVDATADGFSNSGGCGVLATFDIPGEPTDVDCTMLKSAPTYQALYAFVQAALILTTGFLLLNMARSTIDKG